jgi:Domain of unknown function (DUF5666)
MRRLITGVILVNNSKRNRKGKALLSLGAVMATSAGLAGVTAPLAWATPVTGLTFTASVIGVGSGSFTVRRANQAVTVEVSASTTYGEQGVTSPSLSNVLIGDRVTVDGSITSNNDVVDANHVQVLPLLPNDFDGTISSIGTGTFVAMRGNSPVNVDVSSQTTYSVGGVAATFSSLSEGDRIIVHGTSNTGGSIVNALQVDILGFGTLKFTATVSSVGPDSFIVRRINAPITVQVSKKTSYSEHGVTSPSFSNVLAGERVTVNASDTASPTVVSATHVQIVPLMPIDFTAKVTQVGSTSFVVMRGKSMVTVNVSANTKYTQRGVKNANLSDLKPGDGVIVHGTSDPGGTVVNAAQVYINAST